jgi:preprotein translocase subunit YajC
MKTLTRTVLVLIVLAIVVIAAMIWVPVQRTQPKAMSEHHARQGDGYWQLHTG